MGSAYGLLSTLLTLSKAVLQGAFGRPFLCQAFGLERVRPLPASIDGARYRRKYRKFQVANILRQPRTIAGL